MRAMPAQEILPPEDADTDSLPKLTVKQLRYVEGVLSGKNGTQSAKDAGYSKNNAHVISTQLLKNPRVAEYLRIARAKINSSAEYSAAEWLKELRGIAHSNIADFTQLNDDGELRIDFSTATREQLAALQSVKTKKRKIYDRSGQVVGEEAESEFRLWDKLRAAELLGKHAGFLKEPEQKIVVDVADRLLNARHRLLHAKEAK